MKKISFLKFSFMLVLCGLLAVSCGKGGSEDDNSGTNTNGGGSGSGTEQGGSGSGTGTEEGGNGSEQTTEYTLTFDVNGATGSIDALKFTSETTIPDASVLTYAEHSFLGWSTDKNATTAQYKSGDKYTGKSATLYAVWAQIYKIIYHYDINVPDTKSETTYTSADLANGTVKIHYDVALADNQQLAWKDASGNTYNDGDKPAKAANLELWAEIANKIDGATTSEEWNTQEYQYPNN
ncbi:MAG: InlB B-repeat-containing protein [Bacteroidales bacterium]|nr:InlB B-repeat-containing protein [Bacteroidales bacterium]